MPHLHGEYQGKLKRKSKHTKWRQPLSNAETDEILAGTRVS